MNNGLKNTIAGVLLTALLGVAGWFLVEQSATSAHFSKIDTILQQNHEIIIDLQSRTAAVPPVVEAKLDELRNRLNSHEARMNNIDAKTR